MLAESTSTFSALLRRHRLAAGLTQEALAERAGLSVYGIQKLERGITHPYRDTAVRLASALALAPDEAERFRAAVEPVRRRGAPSREAAAGERRHNLPASLTNFIGREQELARLAARLPSARLLTLTGVGGSGKTRLAIELARQLVDEYRDGVQLVELAPEADPALVPHRLAGVLGVQPVADQPLEHALNRALRDSHLLLVLDNCEHLLDACAAMVNSLLRECPHLQVIATSREPIGIPGEVTWAVAPLATPNCHVSGALGEIAQSAAVRLFVDRASAAEQSFVLAADNADVVAQICRRLDGIPLTLELAAARLDALTVDQLASRLDLRFALLTGGNRAALPRQQTLSATIDWSYFLLSEPQRRVFERLSVFATGWSLEAAETVCAGDGVAVEDVLDAVLQLVRKSLVVRADARQGAARYGLLETLRQYAWAKLRDRGDGLSATRERHAAYYSALVERLDPAAPATLLTFSGETLTADVVEQLDDAHDNLRVALRWWADARRPTEGLMLVRALVPLWTWMGIPVDGHHWVQAMLDLASASADTDKVSPALHAQALMLSGIIPQMQGDYDTARAMLESSVALWRALGDDSGLTIALANLGLVLLSAGAFEAADVILSEGLALARPAGDAFAVSGLLAVLGALALAQKQYERATAYLRDGLAVARIVERESYRAMSVIRALVLLSRAESRLGAHERAMALVKEALASIREAGLGGRVLCVCLDALALEVRAAGDPVRAARLFGAADVYWRKIGAVRVPFGALEVEDELRALRAQLPEAVFARAWNEGQVMEIARVFADLLDKPVD